ncbi:oxidoreductase [Xylaria palmicola]|nr:oxidoreductase [Xylaria palmicola]
MLLDDAILERHSSRVYLPTPVPRRVLERALALAAHAPSHTNTQAWQLFVVTGDALSRLKTDLAAAALAGPPNVRPLPAAFEEHHHELGRVLYGEGWGLARGDREGRRAAVLRNFAFFGAPAALVVCAPTSLDGDGAGGALSVGMHLQTLLLALTAAGVGSCVEVSVAGYADVVRHAVGIPDDMTVLVGVAVGFEDAGAQVNRVRMGRDPVERHTVWVGE